MWYLCSQFAYSIFFGILFIFWSFCAACTWSIFFVNSSIAWRILKYFHLYFILVFFFFSRLGSFGFPFTICTHYFPLSFLFCFCSTILSQLIFYFISSVLYLVYFTFCLLRYTCESILLDTIHNLFEIIFSYSSKLQFEHFTSCLSYGEWRRSQHLASTLWNTCWEI